MKSNLAKSRRKTSVSEARSYRVIGEFWDTHDLADYWHRMRPVKFEVAIRSKTARKSGKTSC